MRPTREAFRALRPVFCDGVRLHLKGSRLRQAQLQAQKFKRNAFPLRQPFSLENDFSRDFILQRPQLALKILNVNDADQLKEKISIKETALRKLCRDGA
ncbi:MAG: hypothetical protein LBB79_08820 [Prevotellaceae bacterium]|nr:hypothetical protein [Prevotellaceae bacterium]